MQNGADVARETADVVLMHPKRLMSLAQAIELSRCCMKLIRDNVAIVAAPNAAALVLATAGWLNPVGATLLNNGSTIVAGVRSLQPLLSDTRSSGKAGKANGRVEPSPPVSSELAVPA